MPSRLWTRRKPTTARSPNMLRGSSQRLYKRSIPIPPSGEVSAYFASPPGLWDGSLQKECRNKKGLGIRAKGVDAIGAESADLDGTTGTEPGADARSAIAGVKTLVNDRVSGG